MSSRASNRALNLSARLQQNFIIPTRGLCFYLGVQNGATDELVYAAIDNPECVSGLCRVIEVVFSILKHGDFKVGHLHVTREYLVKCRSAEDANTLHLQVKVCGTSVIGFRKMKEVHVVNEIFPLLLSKIRDAFPEEWTYNNEVGAPQAIDAGAPQAPGAGGPKDSSGASARKDDAEASGSKKRKI